MFSQTGGVTQCYIMYPACTRTWVTSQAWKNKLSQKVPLHLLSPILLISSSILHSLQSSIYIFIQDFYKLSLYQLLLYFFISSCLYCVVCACICPFKCVCVHTHTCFVGPRLRSGIFLDHSFSFILRGTVSQPNQNSAYNPGLASILVPGILLCLPRLEFQVDHHGLPVVM